MPRARSPRSCTAIPEGRIWHAAQGDIRILFEVQNSHLVSSRLKMGFQGLGKAGIHTHVESIDTDNTCPAIQFQPGAALRDLLQYNIQIFRNQLALLILHDTRFHQMLLPGRQSR